jgi:hypothetical protein
VRVAADRKEGVMTARAVQSENRDPAAIDDATSAGQIHVDRPSGDKTTAVLNVKRLPFCRR